MTKSKELGQGYQATSQGPTKMRQDVEDLEIDILIEKISKQIAKEKE